MGSGQNDTGLAHASRFFDTGPTGRAATAVAPGLTGLVVPAKRSLQEIWMAETSKDAEAAFDAFIAAYELWAARSCLSVEQRA